MITTKLDTRVGSLRHNRTAAAMRRIVDELIVLGIGCALALCAIGVPLAILGWYRPIVVIPAIVFATAGIWRELRVRLLPSRTSAAAILAVTLGLLALTATHIRWSSQHFAVDRDPGVYTLTAQWLAEEGDLLVPGLEGPFRTEGFTAAGAGFYDEDRADAALNPQFLHLTAAALAIGDWLGGEWLMFRVNAVIGMISCLTLFALVSQFVRSWIAVGATLAMAASLPQVWFSRDTFSEPLAQLLLLGGLLLMHRATAEGSAKGYLIAGAAIGAVFSARIDGVLILAAFSVIVAIALISRDRDAHKRAALLVTGAAVTVTIGVVDLLLRSPGYARGHDREIFVPLAVAIAIVLVAWFSRHHARRALEVVGTRAARFTGDRARLATILGVAVAGVGVAAWQIRPIVQHVATTPMPYLTSLANRAGIDDVTRVYHERSVEWLAWYLGPFTIVLAIAGAGIVVHRAVLSDHRAADLLIVLGIPTALYLWNPRIYPDQIWAMRRYMPAALPLMVILAACTCEWLWQNRRSAGYGRAVPVVAVATMVVPPLVTLVPLHATREMNVPLATVDALCQLIGDDAAVAIPPTHELHIWLPQTVRIMCGVPVGIPSDSADTCAVEAAWSDAGRELLYLVNDTQIPAGTQEIGRVHVEGERLERTLIRRPETTSRWTTELVVVKPPSC